MNLPLPKRVGDITKLITNDKSSVVNAINENVTQLTNVATDVTKYGAKGDGTTDDTTVIQNVINSVTSGIILFPANKTFVTSTLIVSNSNVILIILGTLKTDGITITGDNSGIMGYGIGVIDNKLKYASVATQVAQGATEITLTSNPFSVGDGVQSSYGLGSDGSNPVQITAINGNTITVTNATSSIIPVGANIGTYQWSATVGLKGNGSFCNGINFINARGYSFYAGNSSARKADILLKNCIFDKNGLDIGQAINCDNLVIDNCQFLYNVDCAKQGLVVIESIIKIFKTIFNRMNSDVDIYITGANTITEIYIDNECEFDGGGNTHPSPYNNNSWNAVQIDANANSIINSIITSNSIFQNYLTGIIATPSGNSKAITVNKIKMSNCTNYNAEIGNQALLSVNDYVISNCDFDGQGIKTNASWFTSTNNFTIKMQNCKIKNDNTTKTFQNVELVGCEISNCTFTFAHASSYIKDLILVNTTLGVYPYGNSTSQFGQIDNLIISNSNFVGQQYVDNIANFPKAGDMVCFTFLNGTLKGYIVNFNNHMYYKLIIKIFNGNFPVGLMGDDWYIPVSSTIEDFNQTTNRFKLTTKSNSMVTTAIANNGDNTITVNNIGTSAIGDYINISCADNRVQTNKITGISGTTITLLNNLIYNVNNNANICTFLF